MREPFDGVAASEQTDFRVVFTPSTLYFGVQVFDSEPDKIIAKEMGRDSSLFQDDGIGILIDTFNDDRNAYLFETNMNGARNDGLITDEGRDNNFNWDGVWHVAAKPTSTGWIAEIAIPFSTLRFNRKVDTWGLNIRRRVKRKGEESSWAPIARQFSFFRVSVAGDLVGLSGLKAPSRQLDIKPFVVTSANEDHSSGTKINEDEVDVGLDIKWGVTKGLALDLTLNTDFAETEVDDQRVNLTRFSLFFPEKREFFLENAGIFEFGLVERGFGTPLIKIFHSRRIGLSGGEEVPILGGARLTGRVGRWNLGVLDVVTDEETFDDGDVAAGANFAVVRLKRNVGERSSVGFIFTDRNDEGPLFNRVYGVDADFKVTQKIETSAFLVANEDVDFAGSEWAGGAAFGFRGRELRFALDLLEASELFNPRMGFLRRTDFQQVNPSMKWRPRIDKHGIRNLRTSVEMDYFSRSSDGVMETRELRLSPFGFETTRDKRIELTTEVNAERLFEPFDIQEGIVVPPGRYEFHRWELDGRTRSSAPLSVRGKVSVGEFFDGDRLSTSASLDARVSRFFGARTSFNYDDVDLPGGDFITRLFSQRLDFAFTPDLVANAFAQFNEAAELVSMNLRFNWIYRPGADLFVVYNENWNAPTFSSRDTLGRTLTVKFTYLWQS